MSFLAPLIRDRTLFQDVMLKSIANFDQTESVSNVVPVRGFPLYERVSVFPASPMYSMEVNHDIASPDYSVAYTLKCCPKIRLSSSSGHLHHTGKTRQMAPSANSWRGLRTTCRWSTNLQTVVTVGTGGDASSGLALCKWGAVICINSTSRVKSATVTPKKNAVPEVQKWCDAVCYATTMKDSVSGETRRAAVCKPHLLHTSCHCQHFRRKKITSSNGRLLGIAFKSFSGFVVATWKQAVPGVRRAFLAELL